MKKFLTLLLALPFFAMAQESGKQFVITGNVTGLADGEVKITTTQNDHATVASGMSSNGVFSLKGSVPEPGLYFLVLSSEQPQYVYLENVAITVTGNKNDIKNLKIEGSQAHKDFIAFNQIFNPIMGNLNATAAQLQREAAPEKRQAFIGQYDSLIRVLSAEVGNFVAARPASYVSPFLLWVTAQVTPDILVLEQHYNLLDTSISRQTQIGRSLGQYIASGKVGAVGTDAIDFTQNDTSGTAVSLSSFKGKYVLVDFWASWCRPCRIENPNIVKNYHRFKHKNFTVLGVSLDQQKEAWVQAIHKDKLHWSHVSDLQQWNNAAAQLYHIQSIPGNFLMDPSGKIVAKNLHGEELEKTLRKYLGEPAEPREEAKPATNKPKSSKQKTTIKKRPVRSPFF